MAERVEIVEVGPRDGLQNERAVLLPARRAELVSRLLAAGVDAVEAVAFVSAKRVPQMAGAEAVVAGLDPSLLSRVTALAANVRGFERAAEAGLSHIRCVVAASERMNRENFRVGTEDTLGEIRAVAALARERGASFGVVIGTAFGCPWEGSVPAARVLDIASRAAELGAREVVLADTTGVAHPEQVGDLCRAAVTSGVPHPACHFHNTRNTGYANVVRALDAGIRRFDASIGGAGGCPFAPGASGNVATEDLVHMLAAMGFDVRADVGALVEEARRLGSELGRELPGQVMRAGPVEHVERRAVA